MDKIKQVFKAKKKYFLIGLPILIILAIIVFKKGTAEVESFVVEETSIEQSVALSGKVTTSDKADLGFAAAGRVSRISVKNNQSVAQGATLAQLEIGDLLADLRIKQANSRTSDVDLESAKDELEKVTAQEDTKVASAYRALLTEDLELIPNSNTYDVEAPTISGIYDGAEGQYKIRILRENAGFSNLQLFTFELEKTERIINEEGSTPLGTKGLFISFEDDLDSYHDTIWFLNIPNKSGASYLVNYNAYNEAKNDRNLAIKNAEADYQKLLTENDGGDSVAQAEIQKINAEIRKNTIYAPFKGVVTNIEKEVGENASLGERVISILGESKLEVVLQVSELDVSKLVPDSEIEILIDALPNEKFYGTLKTINSRETEIDGVPVYEAFVELASDPRIKTGMNARGTVVLFKKDNVLAIPSYFIKKNGDVNTVAVIGSDGKTVEREVTLGLSGTDSMVEVTSGISLGEKVVSNGNESR